MDYEVTKALTETFQDGTEIVYIAKTADEKTLLATSGNYLVSRFEAEKMITVCKAYLSHINEDDVNFFNGRLLEERRIERYKSGCDLNAVKRKQQTQIYLMKNNRNGYIKIGRSVNISYREKTLQSQDPDIELIFSFPGTIKDETFLHGKYADKRIRGEWFSLSQEDIEQIIFTSIGEKKQVWPTE